MSEKSDHADERAYLARVVSELIAVRRARLLSMWTSWLWPCSSPESVPMQAQGTRVDTVLLFSAFSLIMIGIVCALGAILAWTRINRDVLDSAASAKPARDKAPRTRNTGMAVAIGFAVLGLLFGWMLFTATPILAIAIVLACAVLACLGPIWANELSTADDRFARVHPRQRRRTGGNGSSTYTPIWLHEAMENEKAGQDRA